jgi:hypothetical protein
MPDFFFHSLWPGLAFWSLLYISDYALTVTCARLYRAGACEKFVFEGSYELTPFFQRDIDSLRAISPRFLAMWLLSGLFLSAIWLLAAQSLRQMYAFGLGALVLVQLTIHIRHLRNFSTFRSVNRSDCVRGRIEYSRPFLLQQSSIELFCFSALYAILFVFTQSWFVLGGAASCLSTAIKHRRWAHKGVAKAPVGLPPRQQPTQAA